MYRYEYMKIALEIVTNKSSASIIFAPWTPTDGFIWKSAKECQA